tara:strand:- start:742 stop:1260 length:519 start_codon:yes stop_codon:yes gene_type:complete
LISKLKKIFFIVFIFTIITPKVLAEDKIAYVDMDLVLSSTIIGKEVFKKLSIIEKEKNEEFNIQEKNLKNEENKILASRNIISEEQLNINIKEFQETLRGYRNLKSQELKKLKKVRNQEMMKLLNIINPIIQEYMQDNSISIIFDKKNIYIANKNYDISLNLIELIDKKIKK